jgi:Protein of unknown function (DUF1573)
MIYMGRIGMALIGVLVLAAVCRSVTLKVERHSASEAILYIPQRSIDLGTLNTREVRYYTFELLNQGRRRLVINQLDDCGCGEPEQATVVIAPGEYGQVSVRLDTREVTGQLRQVFRFTTNDPKHPAFELALTALVTASAAQQASGAQPTAVVQFSPD